MKRILPAFFIIAAFATNVSAQQGEATGEEQVPLPDVEAIQAEQSPAPAAAAAKPKPKPAAAAAKPKPKPQPAAYTPPPPPVETYNEYDDYVESPAEIGEPAQVLANSPYGSTAGVGAAQRAEFGAINPVNARQILPGDLQNYAGSGGRVTPENIAAQRPITNHEALARIPGVVTVNDDGFGRHGGIGIRGSNPRRGRKVLINEDGQPITFAPYLDSSTHYTPPIERIESIEVIKGNVVAHGPLNNFGIVNFRNLSPFGANETLLKFGIGYTEGSDRDWNNFRHVHTRQNFGNVGVVASYSGADAGGSWDNEVIRYNDFYGAIGFKGVDQDLTISGGYHRQRDTYDETNFEGTERDFFANGRRKAGVDDELAPFLNNSNYNGEHYRLQIAHNYYFDKDTTLTTRLYGADHERPRFYPDSLDEDDLDGDTNTDEILFEGRDRRYRNYGIDTRIEFANLQLFHGITHDFQAGLGYREEKFSNTNRAGEPGMILDFNNRGFVTDQVKLDAQIFNAFMQTAIHVTPKLTVTPGVRFEAYDVNLVETVGETDDYLPGDPISPGDRETLRSEHTHVLPMIAFAWEFMPKTTLYGGYHRGLTPHIVRDANETGQGFPIPEEVGDNFQLGLRSKALRGLSYDIAYFHHRIENYQFKEAFLDDNGVQVFGNLDEAVIQGVEIGARLDSRPFHGGPWNFFGEANYTYAHDEIESGRDAPDEDEALIDVSGNRIPQAIRHFAHLTLGVEHQSGWDLSLSYTYRGDFHTDSFNTPYGGDDEGEVGLVPDVWLLSARGNFKVNDQLTLFVAGQNLTDEFYITDRSDGLKPGIGRTIFGGFTLKFDN